MKKEVFALVDGFECVVSFLCEPLQSKLRNLNFEIRNSINEICLRIDKPVVLISNGNTLFLDRCGRATQIYSENLYCVTKNDINLCFNSLCRYSVYSYTDSIVQGFITITGGHRVGVSGTAVMKNSIVTTIRDVNSLNIRIAGEFKGCADEILNKAFNNKLRNVIIVGPPSSGKTTLLRDIARQISSGRFGEYYKVSVVDERFEISPVSDGVCYCDTGPNTDVLSGFKKEEGILNALRTLSPRIIICDEIGTSEECQAIQNGLNSGVNFVLSIHAATKDELINKPQFKTLQKSGICASVVLLSHRRCEIKEIFNIGDFYDENVSITAYRDSHSVDRAVS